MTCAEYNIQNVTKKLSDEDNETLKLLQEKDARRCPGPNCYLVITKDGGCDSMNCIGCGMHFLWDSAVSAVPGARKATGGVYNIYDSSPDMPCEVDALEQAGSGGKR